MDKFSIDDLRSCMYITDAEQLLVDILNNDIDVTVYRQQLQGLIGSDKDSRIQQKKTLDCHAQLRCYCVCHRKYGDSLYIVRSPILACDHIELANYLDLVGFGYESKLHYKIA